MSADLKRRLMKGVGAKAFGQGVQIVIRLAEVPLFLYFWGAELYGEWLILVALPTYLSMSDFGFANVNSRHMTMLVAKGERAAALTTFQSSSILVLLLSGTLAFLFVLVMWGLPVIDLFNITKIDRTAFLFSVAVLSFQIVFSTQILLLFGGYYCERRYSRGFLFMALIQLGQFSFLAVAIALGAGPVAAALTMLCAQIAGAIGMRVGLLRIAPWLHYGLAHVRKEAIRRLAKPAIAGLAFPLGQAMSHQGTRLVIGAVLGPVAVVLFVTHRQLARLVNLVASLAHPFEAELGSVCGAGDLDAFRRLARRTFQIVVWAVMAAAVGLMLIAEPVFMQWTGGRLEFNRWLFILLLVASVAESLWLGAFFPILAVNRHVGIAKVYALICFALIPMVYLASNTYGLIGVAEYLIAAELIMIWFVVRLALELTRDGFRNFISSVLPPPLYIFQMVRKYLVE